MGKNMVKICMMMLALIACTAKETQLTVNMSSTAFPSEASEFVLTIDSSSPWSISFDDWWVTFSQSSGPAGKSEVKGSVKENTALKERKDVITVTSGDKVEKITVTQSGATAFELSKTFEYLPWTGGEVRVQVTSSSDYEVTVPEGCTWITKVANEALGKDTHCFMIAENKGTIVREEDICFSSQGQVLKLHIMQEKSPGPMISDLEEYKRSGEKKYPIVGFWGVGGEKFETATRKNYAEMAAAGFNISLTKNFSVEKMKTALEAAQGTGIELIAGPWNAEYTEEWIRQVMEMEGVYAYYLKDEPPMDGLDALKKNYEFIRSIDKDKHVYVNLFPIDAQYKFIKTYDYDAYVEKYLQIGVPMLSYDNYCITGEDKHLKDRYFENLDMAAKKAVKYNVPCWTFVLSLAHGDYMTTDEATFRFQAWNGIAYGSSAIQYYTYQHSSTAWGTAILDKNFAKTEKYYYAQRLNAEIQGLADVFVGMNVKRVRGISRSETGLPALAAGELPAPFKSISTTSPQGMLMSYFSNGDKEYVMIVNLDYNDPQTLNVEFDGERPTEFVTTTEYASLFGTRAAVKSREVPPGDMVLYRIK